MHESVIFANALKLATTAERGAYLDEACAGDPQLRAGVEALLEAQANDPGFLEKPLATLGRTVAAVSRGDAPGRAPGVDCPGAVLAGRYKLVEAIGEGGMGNVWMAQQTEPVKRLVAVKLVKAGMDPKQVLGRFEAERQALALMDHPNIAKVLDAGAAPDGRPFFVMELVKGIPITTYCDQHHLTPRQRMELFVPVCQAIQHAHQKGIIHRDIKPSNVLVARYDDRPVPKVIDFGVAKATGPRLTEATLHTGFGAVVGTVEYMSPEQASFNQLDVDTRSDVYALGVLLYELLAGGPPFSREELKRAGVMELLRVIREQEPPKPSTKLSTAEGLPTLAANRGTEPAKLTRLVRGELDWIVMKALEKDRDRRYESANGLALDLQRYLADEPVLAGPPSARYRLRKFYRRHCGAVLAAGIIVLSLIGGAVGTTYGMLQAQAAEHDAVASSEQATRAAAAARQARQLAEKRLTQVEAGIDLLASVFTELDPKAEEKEGRPLQAILGDRVWHAANQLEGESVGDLLAVARLQDLLGGSLNGLGHSQQAIMLHKQALSTYETQLGPEHLRTLSTIKNLGSAYLAAGEFDKALPLLEQTREKRQASLGALHPETLKTMNSLALAYGEAGKLDKALPLLEQTLAQRRKTLGPNHPDTLMSMNNLAGAYQRAHQLDKAVPLYEETLAKQLEMLATDHPDTLLSMHNLAGAYQQAGQLDKARALYEQAMTKYQQKLGPEHPATWRAANNLAHLYLAMKQSDKALPLFEQVLAKRRDRLGPDHPQTLSSMNNLAGIYWNLGQFDRAIELFRQVLPLQRRKLGDSHPAVLMTLANLAVNYRDVGQLTEAAKRAEEFLAISKTVPVLNRKDSSWFVPVAADIVEAAGPPAQAEPIHRAAVEEARSQYGSDDPRTVSALVGLGSNLLKQQKAADAEPILRDCLAIREKKEPDSWTTFNSRSLLGDCLLSQKNYADAELLLLTGYEGLAQRAAKIPELSRTVRLTEALQRLVRLYDAWGKPDEAARWRMKLDSKEKQH